ncbi:MAG: ATPase, partial [Phototrophicales bacterium]
MITHIEISGFKSFQNLSIDLRPFQVLIGPNGVGKSNLFDAISLLSDLADNNTLYDAFRKNRGEVNELFSISDDVQDNTMRTMSFAVEMLIAKTVTDALGVTADVTSSRLRYELTIQLRKDKDSGFQRMYVVHESLDAITERKDKWYKKHIPSSHRTSWIVRNRRGAYISTESGTIYKHQDGRQGRKQETPIGQIERTILSTINSTEYPTAYAVRQEMLNWKFLQLNPLELRTPSHIYDPDELTQDGSNLAAVLHRLANENEFALKDVSLDMANLVPGILEISVKPSREREEFLIEATSVDGSKFSSRILSDGTLRLLTLVTLRNDPKHFGLL